MTGTHITPREFSEMASVPYTTAVYWFRHGRLKSAATKQEDGTWTVPRREAERVVAERRNADLLENRLGAAVEVTMSVRDKRAALLGARLAFAAARFAEDFAVLSAKGPVDGASLRSAAAALTLAAKEVEALALYDGLLDEMSRETRDDEWTDPEDFGVLTKKDSNLEKFNRIPDDSAQNSAE